jgi:hypothetical protein
VTVRHRNASSYLECKHCIAACLVGRYVALSPCDLTVSEQEINQEIKQERDKMSKNLTRKGLAFGALLALGASVIAGTPAHAAPSGLTLASSYGTSLNTILGQAFDINLTAAGTTTGTSDAIKYYIEGAKAADINAVYGRGVSDVTTAASGASSVAYAASVGTVASVDDAAKTAVIGGATKTSTTGALVTAGVRNQLRISLNSTNITSTTTIKVTPFLDNVVADGKVTAGTSEVAGNTLSITFVKASEITATTKLSAPALGATSLSATVTLDKDINLEQLRWYDDAIATSNAADSTKEDNSVLSVEFKSAGSAVSENWARYNSSKAAAYAKTSGSVTVTANTLYTAQAKIAGAKSGDVVSASAATGSVNIDETSVGAAKLTATKNENVKAGSISDSTVADNYTVRTGATAVSFTTEAINKLNDDTSAALVSVGAGVPARITLTADATNYATGSTYTISGKSVTKKSESTTIDTTTNADGKVVFDLTGTGAVNDVVTVKVEVLDEGAWVKVEGSSHWIKTITWKDSAALHLVTTNVGGAGIQNVKGGGSYTLNFTLADEFGKLYTGDRRVYLYASSTSAGALASVADQYATFSGGKASITLNDANAGSSANTATYDVIAQVRKLSGSSWVIDSTVAVADNDDYALSGAGSDDSNGKVSIYPVSSNTVGFLTINKTGDPTISYKTFASLDGRVDTNTFSASSLETAVEIDGVAYDANGTKLPGTPVTISGAGILFRAETASNTAQDVFGLGSVTVLTDADGKYFVKAYSNKAGEQVITATAGTVSKTTTPKWAAAVVNKATAGYAITITAPTSAAPGTTAPVVVKLADKYGNPVKTDGTSASFTVRVTGAGSPSSFTAATNSDGELKFNQVIGSGETGSFKVEVTFDGDAATNTIASITKSATVAIAAPAVVVVEPVSKIGTANGRIYANVKDGKGSVVTVRIANKWFTKTALNNDYTFSFKNKKGAKVSVKVYVDGDLSASKTITVK